jgi:hypothetical protein
VVLNDAGIGLDQAGIGCLAYCEALGMAAARVGDASAGIGEAANLLRDAPAWQSEPPPYREGASCRFQGGYSAERPG